MKTLFEYFWQANIALLLCYAVYWAFLRRDTFFRWNRFYLLFALAFALALPLLPVPVFFQNAVPEDQVLLFFGEENAVTETSTQVALAHSPTLLTWENALLAVYLMGVMFLFIRLIFNLLAIVKLVFKNKFKNTKQGYFIVQTNTETPIFSFLNVLFWNENANILEEQKAKILAHELVHIRQWHSLDVLLMELMTVVFWCNPIIWAYKKSLQAIHEYLADAKVLEQETSKTEYANLLVSQFLQTNTLYLTNHFFSKSLLKNRIMMMYQKKSTQKALAKFAFVVPMVAICLLVAACTKELNSLQVASFNFIQGFDLQEKYVVKNNKEIILNLEEQTTYMTRLANGKSNFQGITLELYNAENEMLATSFVNKRYFQGWTYKSKNAGKYRLVIKMTEEAEEGTLVGVAKRVDIFPPKDGILGDYTTDRTSYVNIQLVESQNYQFLFRNKNVDYGDVSMTITSPNGTEIPVRAFGEDKNKITWRFQARERGFYKVNFQLKNRLSESATFYLLQDVKTEILPKANTQDNLPSPYSVKEYEAPANKTSEYTLILSKNITYSFRMAKGSAKLEIKNDKGEVVHASENGELVIKNVEKVGIYKLFITPKDNTDAKVALAFVQE